MSRKFFTPPQPSPYQGEGVRNLQMIEDCYKVLITDLFLVIILLFFLCIVCDKSYLFFNLKPQTKKL
ncbi:hypothetical protein D0A34_02855 [Microcoleus vaginatus PCC 9802]|nr:hypothetical protein MicvaDRAFT_2903 [Microcoleus vaginatus FGP-2]UNU17943.1 hypothetical protein D0A34_02855 [Microcoleus vaginatus PCC 9802]